MATSSRPRALLVRALVETGRGVLVRSAEISMRI